MADRKPRTTQTREKTQRKKAWVRPSALPDPEQENGVEYRWVRTSTLGNSDTKNVSSRFREGWEAVADMDVHRIDRVKCLEHDEGSVSDAV